MDAPLMVKWFQTNVKPHVNSSGEYKNLESHVKGCENLEKNWKKAPVDPKAVKLLNNSLNNVQSCINAVKKPNAELKAAQKNVVKAIKTFKEPKSCIFKNLKTICF